MQVLGTTLSNQNHARQNSLAAIRKFLTIQCTLHCIHLQSTLKQCDIGQTIPWKYQHNTYIITYIHKLMSLLLMGVDTNYKTTPVTTLTCYIFVYLR